MGSTAGGRAANNLFGSEGAQLSQRLGIDATHRQQDVMAANTHELLSAHRAGLDHAIHWEETP